MKGVKAREAKDGDATRISARPVMYDRAGESAGRREDGRTRMFQSDPTRSTAAAIEDNGEDEKDQ